MKTLALPFPGVRWPFEVPPSTVGNATALALVHGLLVLTPLIAILPIVATPARSEDVVVFKVGQDGRGRSQMAGEILDYTGKELRLRTQSGREAVIPAERVVTIDSDWQQKQAAADDLLNQGESAKALDLYLAAVREQPRVWVRRRILAQCVRCYYELGKIEQAGAAFLIVLRSDPATQYFDAIPLSWTTQQPTASLQRQAASWLEDETTPAASLMGASWLLSSTQRAKAISKLQRLTTGADSRVALLAEAQLWRSKIVTATPQDVPRWQAVIDRMPSGLRGGPYYLLGQLLARHDLHEQAAVAYLRVPILYPQQRGLSAECLLASGEQLEKLGQTREALGLYRELISGYSATQAASEAQQRITDLQRKQSSPP